MRHTGAGNTGAGNKVRRTLAVAVGGVSIAAVLSGAGLAAANAGTGSPVRAASTAAASKGTEQFYLMTTLPSASQYQVIVTGLFTASGVDISGNTTDTVRLPGGTFKVHHGGNIHIIKESVNPKTCVAMFEGTAGLTIGNGTGKYKGISGSGKATISSLFLARRTKGVCNPNLTPVANQQTIVAKASVKL